MLNYLITTATDVLAPFAPSHQAAIDCVRQVDPYRPLKLFAHLRLGKVRNDRKCKYTSMFSKTESTEKELMGTIL